MRFKEEIDNPMARPLDIEKTWGTDWQGTEVFEGDPIVFDPETDEVIPQDELEDYLKAIGFIFTNAGEEI